MTKRGAVRKALSFFEDLTGIDSYRDNELALDSLVVALEEVGFEDGGRLLTALNLAIRALQDQEPQEQVLDAAAMLKKWRGQLSHDAVKTYWCNRD